MRYREYEKEYGTKKAATHIKHRVAEIHINRLLKLDRAEKQDEPAPEVDPSELPADATPPTVTHVVTVQKVEDWLKGGPGVRERLC